jgi:2-polyprenyl-3-methyl-5-hydroxy-6-metoxy-1,4-benzoquinol methylase
MQASKYHVDIDLGRENDSHTMLVRLATGSQRVLDLGCSSGSIARALVASGSVVSGVEYDAQAAEEARPYLDRVILADLDTLDLAAQFGQASFDCVLCGDVLEHLRDPVRVLRGVRRLLAPGGSLVASIPNVAHAAVRLALLQGRFDYTARGLLDETHVHFYTRQSMHRLLADAGFVPLDVRRTTAGPFETEIPLSQGDFSPEVVAKVLADPDATTYQFVLRAVPEDADGALRRLQVRAEEQSERINELQHALNAAIEAEEAARGEVAVWRTKTAGLEEELAALFASKTMRAAGPLRRLYGRVVGSRG